MEQLLALLQFAPDRIYIVFPLRLLTFSFIGSFYFYNLVYQDPFANSFFYHYRLFLQRVLLFVLFILFRLAAVPFFQLAGEYKLIKNFI
ncbi:MAG: hypothetical protein GX878_03905 [Firmicutes bacterium]|nr:hypothetical protein [Bacillota bacterium]